MKKILVIEDDPTLRMEITAILTLEGFEVMEADNGLLGLKLAISVLPDMILCDIMMPEMDGMEVLKELRINESTRLIPFVFLTALAERSSLRLGMETGADDYISKPFTRDELLHAIEAHLGKAFAITKKHDTEMRSLREMIISKIPHEMYTPLHGILGFSEVLREDAMNIKPEEIKKISEYITISADRLLNLVNRYNYFIYLFANNSARERVEYKAGASKQMLTEILKSAACEYKRQDDLNFSLCEGYINIPETELETMIRELIDNAFKFSAEGSKIQMKSLCNKENYTIIIEDQGRGISIENIKKIGAFQQFDRNIYEQQGSGLGLAMAKLIVDLNGGKFIIKSELGTGTTITVRLPNT